MALFIKIVDDFGHPDPVSSLADAIIEKVIPKGVGVFCTSTHVAADIRSAINELIQQGEVSVHNPTLHECSSCCKLVSIWHTYSDGTVLCSFCRPRVT